MRSFGHWPGWTAPYRFAVTVCYNPSRVPVLKVPVPYRSSNFTSVPLYARVKGYLT